MNDSFDQKYLLENYFLKLVNIGSENGWKGTHILCPRCGYYVFKGNGYDKCPCGNITIDSEMLRVSVKNDEEIGIEQFEAIKIANDNKVNDESYIENGVIVWKTKAGNRKEYRAKSTKIKKYVFSEKWIYILEDYMGYKGESNLYRINRKNEIIAYYNLENVNDGFTDFSISNEIIEANTWECMQYRYNDEMKAISVIFTK